MSVFLMPFLKLLSVGADLSYLDSIVYSSDCDLSINDLWSSFREELTSGIKRLKLHRLTSSRNGLLLCVPLFEMPHEETA